MRIVGGIWKGRPLDAPPGRETRPTSDRVRESIASSVLSIFNLSLESVRVLDAFAGSGAFGLEMLSRGAAHCTFVDERRAAVQTIKKNISSLRPGSGSTAVVCADIAKAIAGFAEAGAVFDLVFLDPPYAMPADEVAHLVQALADAGCATMDSVIVYERASAAPQLSAPALSLLRTKKLGETAVDYYRIGASDEA